MKMRSLHSSANEAAAYMKVLAFLIAITWPMQAVVGCKGRGSDVVLNTDTDCSTTDDVDVQTLQWEAKTIRLGRVPADIEVPISVDLVPTQGKEAASEPVDKVHASCSCVRAKVKPIGTTLHVELVYLTKKGSKDDAQDISLLSRSGETIAKIRVTASVVDAITLERQAVDFGSFGSGSSARQFVRVILREPLSISGLRISAPSFVHASIRRLARDEGILSLAIEPPQIPGPLEGTLRVIDAKHKQSAFMEISGYVSGLATASPQCIVVDAIRSTRVPSAAFTLTLSGDLASDSVAFETQSPDVSVAVVEKARTKFIGQISLRRSSTGKVYRGVVLVKGTGGIALLRIPYLFYT